MSSLRALMIVVVQFALLVLISCPAVAQLEKLDYQPGDKIEVEFQSQWFEAEVTEILPGDRALKADFVDGRGRARNWMFTSRNIREIEKEVDPTPEADSEDIAELPHEPTRNRTWKSADGKFSIEAKFIRKKGDEVELLKTDGRMVTVSLATLCPGDNQYVENALNPVTPSDEENPFVITKSNEKTSPNAKSGSSDDSESASSSSNRKGRSGSAARDRAGFGDRSDPPETPGDRNAERSRPDKSSSLPPTSRKNPDSSRFDSPKSTRPSRSGPVPDISSGTPDLGRPGKSSSRSKALWRWIAFSALFAGGLAMFAWGYLNRKLYW